MKFRKKPIVIEAVRFFPGEWSFFPFYPGIQKCDLGVYLLPKTEDEFRIDTLEGAHEVTPGDYIVTGIKGEKYPVKPDIFEMTYEKVKESER